MAEEAKDMGEVEEEKDEERWSLKLPTGTTLSSPHEWLVSVFVGLLPPV